MKPVVVDRAGIAGSVEVGDGVIGGTVETPFITEGPTFDRGISDSNSKLAFEPSSIGFAKYLRCISAGILL